MSILDAEDLATMHQDAGGVLVVYGSSETWGLFDELGAEVFTGGAGADVFDHDRVIGIPRGALGTVPTGVTLTVDGTDYIVRAKTLEEPDGGRELFLLGDS